MGYITEEGLKNLKNYKYVSGGYSVVDKIMNHWWEFFVKLIPLSVAPNLITLVGLIINISGTIIFLYYDPSLTQALPGWLYMFSATCTFIYQTLDAVDGKQARRTGTSSPLGQLFDHGCDSVCVFFGLLSFCSAIRAGTTWVGFSLGFCVTLTFYTQQWEEYHAHVLRTFIGWFGVTEGILITISTIFSVGLTNGGLAVWTFNEMLPFKLPEIIGQLTVPQLAAILALYNAFAYGYQNISYGLSKTSEPKLTALAGLIPVVMFYGEIFLVFQTKWAWENPGYVIMLIFPSYCLMTCRHIICSVCKMSFNWKQKVPLFFLAFPLNKYLIVLLPQLRHFQFKGVQGSELFPETYVAMGVFLITLFLFLKFTIETIYQITECLGIYCLTIKKKNE